jgi:CheY-like chemotaxis protein
LVIENDNEVREFLVEALTLNGYDVLSAENGTTALEILQRKHDIRFVLVDTDLSDMPGYCIAEQIKKTSNCPHFIYMASQSFDPSHYQSGTAILNKPFSRASLISCIIRASTNTEGNE